MATLTKPGVLAIIQARMNSRRLPGKMMLELGGGMTPIEWILKRNRGKCKVTQWVLATTDHPDDDPLAKLAETINLPCVRGSESDVLDRFMKSWEAFPHEHVLRITGDCPFHDPTIINQVIDRHLKDHLDYTSNTHPPHWPDGLDVEVFRSIPLKEAWAEAKRPSQREHVTPFFYQNPDRFSLGNVQRALDSSHLRITLDEKEDLDLLRTIAKHFNHHHFGAEEVIEWLMTHSDKRLINQHISRNEGYQHSLKEDL
jgi:spore coat polysaccharide biosynthesis protein SpsF